MNLERYDILINSDKMLISGMICTFVQFMQIERARASWHIYHKARINRTVFLSCQVARIVIYMYVVVTVTLK